LGIETGKPRFSWTLTSEKRGASQEAYLIIVSEKPDVWKGTHWDSGVHYTDSTINIEYQGKELESDHTYYWRVLAKVGNKGVWSKASKFHTGILKQSDWKAQWLSVKEAANLASPVFHNQFNISGKVKQAYVYTTAAGLYELSLNENKVGEDVLTPAVTDFRKTVLYSVYDVTNLLRRGMNTFRVMLGNGAYCMIGTQERHSWGQSPLGKPSFMLQMRVVYTDGSEQMVTSGEGWQYTYGPVTYNNLHGGEDYDARLANSAVINAQRAETVSGPGGVLCWQSEPIRVIQTMEPKSSVQPAKGVYLFDLGQNIAGWWRVTVKGAANKTIRVRGCETLNNSLFPKPLEQGDSFSDKYQYHSKVWTDYTMRGSGTEVYEPRFFYTGFRYIEVSTLDGSELEEIAVVGRVAGTSLEKSGNFTCSNQLINKIYNASVWSQKSNLVGYPTDCPHREKGAYNGDGQVIAETSMHDFNMSSFYGKWLDDMRDAQESNGRIPNTSPIIVGGMGGGVAWGSAYVLIPWWMYHYYNDTRQLAKHYPNMKKYIEYLRNLARSDANPGNKYIIDYFDGYWYSLGEWCSPGRTDCPNHAVVNTFYYYYDTKLMSQIALLLGHDADAVSYQALSDSIKEAYISSFFDSETALYGQDSVFQTYQLLPLITDLVPEGRREEVVKSIVEDVIKRDYHLNTGIIGTKYLWYVLPNEGYNDVAYKIATQETYPSYGYWIRQHCTTLLEKWEGYDSHNHQMFGTVNEYFYQYLAGIRSPLNGSSIAYKHIFLQPYFPKGLDVAGATLKTVSGEVDAKWIRKSKDEIKYKVTIPANTTATVILPESSAVSESGKLIWKDGAHNEEVEGISSVERVDNTLKISIQSGSYVFEFSRQ
jgi:alpha-L-rhamnosidase